MTLLWAVPFSVVLRMRLDTRELVLRRRGGESTAALKITKVASDCGHETWCAVVV